MQAIRLRMAASFHEPGWRSIATHLFQAGNDTIKVQPGIIPATILAMEIAPITIALNGESLQIAAACTVTALLHKQGLGERRVAVEINGHIVPRSRHDNHLLVDGDTVEIVHALGGG